MNQYIVKLEMTIDSINEYPLVLIKAKNVEEAQFEAIKSQCRYSKPVKSVVIGDGYYFHEDEHISYTIHSIKVIDEQVTVNELLEFI